MAGRRKLDSRIKDARGQRGSRSYAATPILRPATAEPPECIAKRPDAVAIWNRHAPELIERGMLPDLMKDLFGLSCRCEANAIRELDQMDHLVTLARGRSEFVVGGKGRVTVINEVELALKLEAAALKNIANARMIRQQFGLTPTSLAGVFGAANAPDAKDASEEVADEIGLR